MVSAFNFLVAVRSWNFALAIVCGDPVVWKPSTKTPLTALAWQALFKRALKRFSDAPDSRSEVVIALCKIASRIAGRFGRTILGLGGNNGMIVSPTADLDLSICAILFAAVGTFGQRFTSLRRLIVQRDIYDAVLERLKKAYANIAVGDPLAPKTLVGPLIDKRAFDHMQAMFKAVAKEGGKVTGGGRVLARRYPKAY